MTNEDRQQLVYGHKARTTEEQRQKLIDRLRNGAWAGYANPNEEEAADEMSGLQSAAKNYEGRFCYGETGRCHKRTEMTDCEWIVPGTARAE